MRVRVLGCSGGIGANLRTTSLLIDDDILIDCGTGVGDLTIQEMEKLRHIYLSHSHLDHIVCLPLLIDTIFDQLKNQPIVVHCLPETFDVLNTHIFNWKVWPNFFELPNKSNPVLQFSPISSGDTRHIGGRIVETIEVEHVVPGVAFRIANDSSALAYSGDTSTNDTFWQVLNARERLDLLIIECAFLDRDRELSKMAKHYCPKLLAGDMSKLNHRPKTCISHLKPGAEEDIFGEVKNALPDVDLVRLRGGEVFQL
jgi:ribonuclease BN (tRNA processing enzyme)